MTELGWFLTGMAWVAAALLLSLELTHTIDGDTAAMWLVVVLLGQTIAACTALPHPPQHPRGPHARPSRDH